MHAYLAYKRLTLLWRILQLSTNSVCKQLVMGRVLEGIITGVDRATHGPIRVMLDSAIEYRMTEDIRHAIKSGQYMVINSWKKLVLERIRNAESVRFEANIILYRKLTLLKLCIDSLHVWPWWVHLQNCHRDVRYCRTMIRLMVGEHDLQTNGRHDTRVCQRCDQYVPEDVPHMLFVCPSLHDDREMMWRGIRKVAPVAIMQEMFNMLPCQLCAFWFSGFHCTYVKEWSEMYSAICYSVQLMYTKILLL